MFKVNEYYDGKVKSLSFISDDGPATIGVMAPGEYEFSTNSTEYMTVTSGVMNVMLSSQTAWKAYKPYETFIVPANGKFKVKCSVDTAYKCLYK